VELDKNTGSRQIKTQKQW